VITFDDALSSFAENALPELEKRDIPVALFAGRILREIFGNRIRYYVQVNQGVSVARNKGLAERRAKPSGGQCKWT
jgi:hypothetical protein